MFMKAEDSETKEGLRAEDAVGESLGGALFWTLYRRQESQGRAAVAPWAVRGKGGVETGSGGECRSNCPCSSADGDPSSLGRNKKFMPMP